MAVGPIQFAGVVGLRSVGPFAYANPFGGGLISWVADPANEWNILSYVVVALIACSAAWLINGAMTFFETRGKTAALACFVVIGLLVMMAEGGKFDPMNWQELATAGLFIIAYLSACGRLFAMTEDQKDK